MIPAMLRFTSCQAPNAEHGFSAIAAYLARKLGVTFEHVALNDWRERETRLFRGEIQVGWVCGLPYVLEADRSGSKVELLAAPVMSASRYNDKPVYYSDVIVRSDSRYRAFDDLRDARWAYNEPHSHSGYNITRYMLATKGLNVEFFSLRLEAGSHERALRLLLRSRIDATALDSTVLETEFQKDPKLAGKLRIIESWGPSPIPPWIVHRSLPADLRERLRGELVGMHTTDEGCAILATGGVQRFVATVDHEYDTIRDMYMMGKEIDL